MNTVPPSGGPVAIQQPGLSFSTWTILTDCPLTRRKRTHCVFTAEGHPVFKSAHLWDCVEYLDAIEVREYMIEPGALSGREAVKRLNARKE